MMMIALSPDAQGHLDHYRKQTRWHWPVNRRLIRTTSNGTCWGTLMLSSPGNRSRSLRVDCSLCSIVLTAGPALFFISLLSEESSQTQGAHIESRHPC
jgi:hypothetical protein